MPSNPANPVSAVAAALESASFDARTSRHVVVGTTIGINAVLTRRGARVVYLTTRGFEDIPFIQRINRKYHYDFSWKKPTPMVRRRDCIGAPERLDEEGRGRSSPSTARRCGPCCSRRCRRTPASPWPSATCSAT